MTLSWSRAFYLAAALLLVLGMVLVAPSFRQPRFEIRNQASQAVSVTASWRDQVRHVGPVQPGDTYEFRVNDEAGMVFTAHYADGRELDSEGIYFTAGIDVVVILSEQGIEARYAVDH